ncbi:hypothetical protein HK333_02235, partial [Streptococcus agalactiae]|nr:hypothetical protein [Streptococcus agalactiae]
MKINKLLSDRLEACYSVCRLQNQDYDFLLVASEVDQACFAYDLNSDLAKIVVWEDVGGTMSIIPIPGTMDFLATQKFYPGFKAKDCQVVYASFHGDRLRIFTEDFGRELFHYPEKTPFGHAIWSGRLLNQTCFVFGWRSEKAELRLFHFVDGHLVSELVDAKAASSNVLAFEKDGKAYLFSANNGRGEVTLYQ